jgi:mannose-6-phosphate isomerase-like protein (cupin superfamily)
MAAASDPMPRTSACSPPETDKGSPNVTLICDSFVVIEWTDPGTAPGRPVAGLHVHREDDEAWYVLEGQLGFRLGDADSVVGDQ